MEYLIKIWVAAAFLSIAAIFIVAIIWVFLWAESMPPTHMTTNQAIILGAVIVAWAISAAAKDSKK